MSVDLKHPEGCVCVIFGADGDLSHRKLLPAISNLAEAGLLPAGFSAVGFTRKALAANPQDRLQYFQGDLLETASYKRLKLHLDDLHTQNKTRGNCIFYLAIPPSLFFEVAKRLAQVGLNQEEYGWKRLVVEKPFGHDLQSAIALNQELREFFEEEQIYRIDHYLGKETVQNLMAFRFANGIFEPIWNRRYIDSVQVTVAETLGVEHRANYYEKAGALRDMVSSHLLQLLALVAMEPPASFDADDVSGEKVKALKAIKQMTPEEAARNAVRAQYGPGLIAGGAVPGYRTEPDVSPESTTESFVALRLEVDNWRWAGVPFYLRTGKRLARAKTEIVIQFKCAPHQMFHDLKTERLCCNVLTLGIAPEEQITLDFTAKVPGPLVRLDQVQMKFDYNQFFRRAASTGYETLIYDVMLGDRTNFRTTDQVLQSWHAVMPILDIWESSKAPVLASYEAGSSGPAAAGELLKREGREWTSL